MGNREGIDMELSWFSMGIAGLEAAILIGLLAVLLSRKEHYRYVRGGLIQGFLVVIFLRLWLPWTFWDGREFFLLLVKVWSVGYGWRE